MTSEPMEPDADEAEDAAAPTGDAAAIASGWPRGAKQDLAKRLGLNRRTIYKLLARGAPRMPDEGEWRRWCKRGGVRVRPPLEAGLADLTVPNHAPAPASADGSAGAVSQPAPPPGPVDEESANALLARRRTSLVEEQTIVARNERLRQERTLIHRDDVRATLVAFGLTIVAELADVPALLVKALPEFPVEQRRALRKSGESVAEELRERFTSDLKRRVLALLVHPKD